MNISVQMHSEYLCYNSNIMKSYEYKCFKMHSEYLCYNSNITKSYEYKCSKCTLNTFVIIVI